MELSDKDRLDAITRSGLIDTDHRVVLDHLAEMLQLAMNVPVVLLSTVVEDEQIFSGQAGLGAPWNESRRTPLTHSFCQQVVTTEEPLVVTDARSDPRVQGNEAIEDLGVVAYCGVPMVDEHGNVLGSICAIDDEAREWTQVDIDRLDRIVPILREQLAAFRRRLETARPRPGAQTTTDAVASRDDGRQLGLARSTVDEFLDVAAHDLRSPMTTALSVVETLRAGADTMPPEALYDVLHRTIARSVRLLDRLHAHARAGTTELDLAPVDLNVIVRGVIDDSSAALSSRHVTVHQDSFLPMVEGDAVLLGQLLGNIVRNAIRYATDGERRANVWVVAASTDDGVHLTISDDGPGIDPEIAPDVFTAGVQGERGSDGIGLGLATCRTIVERHGGRIWIDAAPQGGARVNIVLPTVGERTQRQVLIIEDDEDIQVLYGMIVKHHTDLGGEVRIIGTLRAAEESLAASPMGAGDLAIVDLHLPDGDSIELIERLLADGVQVHTVSTAATTSELMRAAANAGATVSTKSTVLEHGIERVSALLAGGRTPGAP